MAGAMTTRRDEILAKIVGLQAENQKLEQKKVELDAGQKNKREAREKTEKVYFEVQRQLQSIELSLKELALEARQNSSSLKTNSEDIASLQRELMRLEDAERINAAYLEQIEHFKEASLSALWRGENRDDGYGAKEYQIDGAYHMAVAKQGILADKRGLGKTLTSLIWADLMESQKIIAITPPDTMQNFAREVRLWAPHRTPIIIGRTARGERDILLQVLKSLPEFVAIINYEAWRKDSTLVDSLVDLQADTLISDEAHRMKEMNTVTNDGVMSIRFNPNMCPNCLNPNVKIKEDDTGTCRSCGYQGFITEFSSIKNVLPMTGTPILNKPQEIYPLLRLIDPANFNSLNNFLRDFCIQGESRRWYWQHGAEKELMKIIGPRFLGRDRNSVGVEIPEAQYIFHEYGLDELSPKQLKAYLQVRDYAQLVLDPDSEVTMSMPIKAVVFLRLRQVLTWPAAIELKYPDGEPSVFLDVHESLKVDKAEELVRELVDDGERVVLFSQFKGPLHELRRRLGSMAVVYDGETDASLRNAVQLDFDPKTAPEKPRWSVVLANYKAAGEGLNFNAAAQMIILDREWNPGRESQAIGRIDRLGQTKPAQIHFIEIINSVDTWLRGIIEGKANMIAGFEEETDVYREAYEALRRGEI